MSLFGKNGHTVESYFNGGKILGTQNVSVGDQLDHVQNHIGILVPDLKYLKFLIKAINEQ